MNDLVEISKKILSDCLGVKPDEKYVSMLFKILPLSIKCHGDVVLAQ